jgi:hypothetical protein
MTRLAHAIPAAGLVVAGFAGTYALHAPFVDEAARRCTMSDAPSQIVVAVERDTQIPVIPVRHAFNSASGVAPGPHDSLLARPGTLMVSARVRLLRIDTATRRVLADAGVAGDAPMAFIQAQPYRADCRTIRHIDTLPWTVPGDTGYARATLTPRETWPDGVPVFAIAPSWSFPYPRQTGDYPISLKERDGMTFRLKAGVFPATLSSPLAYFNFSTTITRTDTGAVIVSWARADSLTSA